MAVRLREYASIGGTEEYTYVDLLPAARAGAGGRGGARTQRGILRTNCVDCLDRTNVAQLTVGLYALGEQLAALGLVEEGGLDPSSPFTIALMGMYTEHGDAIALQYGGSEANKKVTAWAHADGMAHQAASGAERPERTGVEKEKPASLGGWGADFSFFGTGAAGVAQAQASLTSTVGKLRLASSGPGEILTSLQRYYSNSFTDSLKQAAINLFTGAYRPRVHGPGAALVAAAVAAAGGPSSPSGSVLALSGLHLWELESDWHLHAAGGAASGEVLAGRVVGDWWTAPISAFEARVAARGEGHPPARQVGGGAGRQGLTFFDGHVAILPPGGLLDISPVLPPVAAAPPSLPPKTATSGKGAAAEGVAEAASATVPVPAAVARTPARPSRPAPAAETSAPAAPPPSPRLFDDRSGASLFADVLSPRNLEASAALRSSALGAAGRRRLHAAARDKLGELTGSATGAMHAGVAIVEAAVARAEATAMRTADVVTDRVMDAVASVTHAAEVATAGLGSGIVLPSATRAAAAQDGGKGEEISPTALKGEALPRTLGGADEDAYLRESTRGAQATVRLSHADARLYERCVALGGIAAAPSQASGGGRGNVLLTERSEIDLFKRALAIGAPVRAAGGCGERTSEVEAVGPPAIAWAWAPSRDGSITRGPFAGQHHDRVATPLLRALLARGEGARLAEYREVVAGGPAALRAARGSIGDVLLIAPTVEAAPRH